MDFDRNTFVDRCRQAEFTPTQALIFYDELRKFCAPQVQGLGNPKLEPWEQIRQRTAKALDEVQSAKEFESYRRGWAALRQPTVEEERCAMAEKKDHVVSMIGFIQIEEALSRISGTIAFSDLEHWKSWGKMDLRWEDVQAAIDADVIDIAPTPAPKGTTIEQAHQALEQAVKEAGLAGMSWPLAQEHTPDSLWGLAQMVRQSMKEISSNTGMDRSMAGLNGRIFLQLGRAATGDSGYCIDVFGDLQVIHTSASDAWGAFSHEWAHALENVLYTEEPGGIVTNDSLAPLQAQWRQLHHRLCSAPAQGVSLDGIKTKLIQSILSSPLLNPSAKEALKGLSPSPESRKTVFNHLALAMSTKGNRQALEASNSHALAARILADMDLTLNPPLPGKSIWVSYAERFAEICREVFPEPTAEEWGDYFLSPSEQMAHSFESTFPSDALVSNAGSTFSFRYPTSHETKMHQEAWRGFFQNTGPAIMEALKMAPGFPRSSLTPEADPDPSGGIEVGQSVAFSLPGRPGR